MVGFGFIYTLPQQFFLTASAWSGAAPTAGAPPAAAADVARQAASSAVADTHAGSEPGNSDSGATCITCGIGVTAPAFANLQEQRQHFKSDWHRYNVKRRVDRKSAVTEQEFERLLEEEAEVSSISGSDTSDSSSDSDTEDEEQAPEQRQLAARRKSGASASTSNSGPQELFLAADGKPFAVWRCLLVPDHNQRGAARSIDAPPPPTGAALLSTLQQLRSQPGTWCIFMLKGGHFAAAVFRMRPAPEGSAKGHAQDPFELIAHKTFHRYVVRAKAGGKQSSKDATGKFAKSAGSRLRRYNEAALEKDIRQLLQEWAPQLAAAQLLFVQAPGSNGKVIFGSRDARAAPGAAAAGGWLDPSDPRLRRVPLMTQRPTFSELKRVLFTLGTVMAVQLKPAAAAAAGEDASEGTGTDSSKQQPSKQAPPGSSQTGVVAAPQPPGEGGEGEGSRPATPEALVVVPPGGSPGPKKQELPPLLKAAKGGDADRVARLLAAGHDPTTTDPQGRTPYQLAGSKEVRDAMRRYMAENLEQWDWAAAQVPSALTADMEAAQQSKKEEKKARQRAKEKERKAAAEASKAEAAAAEMAALEDEIARAAMEAAAISSRGANSRQAAASSAAGRGRGRGGSSSAGGGQRRTGAAATPAAAAPLTSEEMAARRERAAAAAEARMKALQAAAQQQRLCGEGASRRGARSSGPNTPAIDHQASAHAAGHPAGGGAGRRWAGLLFKAGTWAAFAAVLLVVAQRQQQRKRQQ